jgi:hypothetical protein
MNNHIRSRLVVTKQSGELSAQKIVTNWLKWPQVWTHSLPNLTTLLSVIHFTLYLVLLDTSYKFFQEMTCNQSHLFLTTLQSIQNQFIFSIYSLSTKKVCFPCQNFSFSCYHYQGCLTCTWSKCQLSTWKYMQMVYLIVA